MASRSKKKQRTAQVSSAIQPSGDLRVPITRDPLLDGNVSMTVDMSRMPEPEYSLPVDCAITRLRHGSPEIVCAQLDPYTDTSIIRLLVVRYSKERFIERVMDNKKLLPPLEQFLTSHAARGTAGHFTEMFEAAIPAKDCSVAVVDAEFEQVSYAGGRGGITFYSATTFDMHKIIAGKASSATFTAPVQVTMSMPALADLLSSWDKLAKEVAP